MTGSDFPHSNFFNPFMKGGGRACVIFLPTIFGVCSVLLGCTSHLPDSHTEAPRPNTSLKHCVARRSSHGFRGAVLMDVENLGEAITIGSLFPTQPQSSGRAWGTRNTLDALSDISAFSSVSLQLACPESPCPDHAIARTAAHNCCRQQVYHRGRLEWIIDPCKHTPVFGC